MKRELAKKMNMNIQEFNLLGELPENVEKFDKTYEEMQKNLDPRANIILDSRLSYWCQPT
jgi:cytidylate kinase